MMPQRKHWSDSLPGHPRATAARRPQQGNVKTTAGPTKPAVSLRIRAHKSSLLPYTHIYKLHWSSERLETEQRKISLPTFPLFSASASASAAAAPRLSLPTRSCNHTEHQKGNSLSLSLHCSRLFPLHHTFAPRELCTTRSEDQMGDQGPRGYTLFLLSALLRALLILSPAGERRAAVGPDENAKILVFSPRHPHPPYKYHPPPPSACVVAVTVLGAGVLFVVLFNP